MLAIELVIGHRL